MFVLVDLKKNKSLQVQSQNNAFGSMKNDVYSFFFHKCGYAQMAKWKTHQRQTGTIYCTYKVSFIDNCD